MEKREHPKEKSELHPRNRHRARYDFKQLIKSCPELAPYVQINPYGDESVDFFNPDAVKMLNTALLKHFYDLVYWDIPPHYLCPPIPGRADYIHHIAEWLGRGNKGIIPQGAKFTCLDIGVGANCVYPIIGNKEYGWSFIGTEIDAIALEAAAKTIEMNPKLHQKVTFRLQNNPKKIFEDLLQQDEMIDLVICNPPFHASLAEARAGSIRKLSNLKGEKVTKAVLNFGGQKKELWCDGGEEAFVLRMIRESAQFDLNCCWFSTLISKSSTIDPAYDLLEELEAFDAKILPMGQGNKISRILTWTFLDEAQQKKWSAERWKGE
ncbi:MAG: hypothetical protein RLZZ292_994 [Bacteroidota bacterium]|jgi:23S rRNA (adenine1618-N6)-methyltransferase